MDRKRMEEQLRKRTEEAYARKDGEINYKYFKTEEELPFWKPSVTKTDPHIIDILPFEAGENYPLIYGRRTVRKGDIVYLIDIEVHMNVGPLNEMVVCPAKNYGLPCPICEEVGRMRQEGMEWEEYKDIDTKRRCAYNILVSDTEKERQQGVQIWEVSHRFSEKPILSIAKSPRSGGYIAFSHPDRTVGKSIAFEVASDAYRTVQGHKFVDRDYDITDEILNSTFPLDDLIVLYPYEKIKEMYYGSRRESPSEKTDESPEQEKHRQEPEQETPSPRRRRFTEKSSSECPYNHRFGYDIDKKEDCKVCDMEIYSKCAELADKIEMEEKKKER